ncbi:recombinase family protein [Streptomyces phytohabitans]|uniref:recombinase family protein n=1 Tax=Streptomyces phytohabitans TaxID=1150371 RepID=UPI00345B8FB3
MKIGYAPVSTGGHKLERQLEGLNAAGCRKIFADKKSGKDALRPELKACHAFLDPGDTLVIPSLDRYRRSLQDPINMAAELRERGIGFTSLHENLNNTTPGGRLVFHVFAALAEFIRELIVIGTKEGLAAARARGRFGGRPSVATAEIICAARDLLPDPGRSITSIAKLLGVPLGTLYNHIPDLRELRAGAVPPFSSKLPRGRRIRGRSISPALSVPQLLTPGVRAVLSAQAEVNRCWPGRTPTSRRALRAGGGEPTH